MRRLFALLGALALWASYHLCTAVADERERVVDRPRMLVGCNFPSHSVDAQGEFSVVRPISCSEPVTIHVEKELLLVAYGDFGIKTNNLHFVVHEAAKLTFATGGSVSLQRDEGSTMPLLDIDGDVKVNAGGQTSERDDAGKDDQGGVVIVNEGGSFSSEQVVLFTRDSVTVAGNTPKEKKEDDQTMKAIKDRKASSIPCTMSLSFGTPGLLRPVRYHPVILAAPSNRPPRFGPQPESPWVKRTPATNLATDDLPSLVRCRHDGADTPSKRVTAPTERKGVPPVDSRVFVLPGGKRVTDLYPLWIIVHIMEGFAVPAPSGALGPEDLTEVTKIGNGQVEKGDVVVGDRHCVTANADGTCVLRKSRPHQGGWANGFQWRRGKGAFSTLREKKGKCEVDGDEKEV